MALFQSSLSTINLMSMIHGYVNLLDNSRAAAAKLGKISESSHAGLSRQFLTLRKGRQKSKPNLFLGAAESMIPRFCTIYPGPAPIRPDPMERPMEIREIALLTEKSSDSCGKIKKRD
jgi:hypothetical protein